jgi:hypothetical protein
LSPPLVNYIKGLIPHRLGGFADQNNDHWSVSAQFASL